MVLNYIRKCLDGYVLLLGIGPIGAAAVATLFALGPPFLGWAAALLLQQATQP